MTRNQVARLMLTAMIAAASLGAQAQTSAPDEATAASVPQEKSGKSADRKLQRDVFKALQRTKGLVSTGIAVKAKNGDVILEGGVPESSQMALATKAAEAVPGVKSVRNALTLSQF
ncbi:transport-associated protein [Caballeronia temeraria]|uniref:Transport-associated protein n=1 Tax=Caballeronia temeraria TaxID=1777137 RepID=A0A158APB4_9BURK|nr:BON domain-containing protein [Caballeronia temeraria]SAK59585.1 transport-associated protein [Caballeronia temeraria]